MDFPTLTEQEMDTMLYDIYEPKLPPKADENITKSVYTIDGLNRVRLADELYLVAELMDEFTRDENAAYAKVLETKNKHIRMMQNKIMQLESDKSEYLSRLNRMASAIQEQEQDLNGFLDSGVDHVYQVGWDAQGVPFVVPVIDLTTDEEL